MKTIIILILTLAIGCQSVSDFDTDTEESGHIYGVRNANYEYTDFQDNKYLLIYSYIVEVADSTDCYIDEYEAPIRDLNTNLYPFVYDLYDLFENFYKEPDFIKTMESGAVFYCYDVAIEGDCGSKREGYKLDSLELCRQAND